MEQVIDSQESTERIYKDKAIWVGTFLGGPLVAGYLIAENFKVFNDTDKAKKTWIYAIITTVVVFGTVFMLPENVKIPNQLIPLIYTVAAYYLVQHFQGQNISSHISSGGHVHSWWRILAIGVIGLAITLISVVGVALLSENMENASVSTKTYGRMKHEIAFDESTISETEVNRVADAFTRTGFFDDAVTKYVYAKKIKNTYEISLSIVDGIAEDKQELQPFVDLRADVQTLFPTNKIVFKLVVDNLENVVKTLE